MILRARYCLDADFQPRDNFALRVADGRIVEFGLAPGLSGGPVVDLGDCLLLPGLVNAHTHLDLGTAAHLAPPGSDFVAWLQRMIQSRSAAGGNAANVRAAISQGLAESLAAGTTLLGDVAGEPGLVRQAIAEHSPRPAVVSFGEIIAVGNGRHLAEQRIRAAGDNSHAAADLRIGLSPHALYSVEPTVLAAALRIAEERNLPICIHAAETAFEVDYTRDATGPLRDFLVELGRWDGQVPCLGAGPIEYLAGAGALGPRTLLAHCNYVSAADIATLAHTGTHVAFCPRTHAAFGHSPHPAPAMLRRGVNVCLGTDSLASNPSLSVLAEMRHLYERHEDLGAALIIRMGTWAGARALGAEANTGRIARGLQADLVALPLLPHGLADPCANALRGTAAPHAVFLQGQQVGADGRTAAESELGKV